MCLRVLAERSDLLTRVFGEGSREALGRLLMTREAEAKKGKKVSDGGREEGRERERMKEREGQRKRRVGGGGREGREGEEKGGTGGEGGQCRMEE